MNLRPFLVLLGAGLLAVLSAVGGCGGDGQTGSLTGTGGGSSASSSTGPCTGLFPDQSTDCENCLAMHCASQVNTCCLVADSSCEPLAKEARSKACSGEDCYGTAAMPGPIYGLVNDFGGVDGPGWKAALPLIQCTVTSCPGLCPK